MAKKDPYGTNGGNGGYKYRQPVKDIPNPKKPHKVPYDYSGRDSRNIGKQRASNGRRK